MDGVRKNAKSFLARTRTTFFRLVTVFCLASLKCNLRLRMRKPLPLKLYERLPVKVVVCSFGVNI